MYINTIYVGQVALARALAVSFTAAPPNSGTHRLPARKAPQELSTAARAAGKRRKFR
jgi:hypothetical protein